MISGAIQEREENPPPHLSVVANKKGDFESLTLLYFLCFIKIFVIFFFRIMMFLLNENIFHERSLENVHLPFCIL